MLSRDQIEKVKSVIRWEKFFEQTEFLPKDLNFYREDFQILKNKATKSILSMSAITKMARIWHFQKSFHFYPILDYYKVRTRTNSETSNSESLDLHLIM